jgi:hypothetical protein
MAAHVSVHLRPVKSIRIRIRHVRKFPYFAGYGPASEIQIIDVFGVPTGSELCPFETQQQPFAFV